MVYIRRNIDLKHVQHLINRKKGHCRLLLLWNPASEELSCRSTGRMYLEEVTHVTNENKSFRQSSYAQVDEETVIIGRTPVQSIVQAHFDNCA